RLGPHPCRLADPLGASNSSSPFRNCTEALDTARASQSVEQAKVRDAILTESPTEARPQRTERRTHSCGRRNEATESQLGLSANRPTDRLGVQPPNRQRRGSQDSRPSLPAGTELWWPFLADIAGPQSRKSLRLCFVGLRNRWIDPIAQTPELPDDSRRAPLFRLFGDGWAAFFVTDSLVQDQPDQPTLSMGNGPDGLIVSQARDGAAIYDFEDASFGPGCGVRSLIE